MEVQNIKVDRLFSESEEINQLIQNLAGERGSVFLYGSDDYVFSVVAHAVAERSGRDVIVYFEDDLKARSAFMSERTVYIPPKERVIASSIAHSKRAENIRGEAILKLASHQLSTAKFESVHEIMDDANEDSTAPIVVCTSIVSALEKYPVINKKEQFLHLRVGDKIGLADFYNFLYNNGYEKVHYVEQKCEVSSRGGIIDVYSPMNEHPIRIELFGDEIASMRLFDLATSSSIKKIKECKIYSGGSSGQGDSDYLDHYLNQPIIFVLGASASVKRLRQNEEDFNTRLAENLLLDSEGEGRGSSGVSEVSADSKSSDSGSSDSEKSDNAGNRPESLRYPVDDVLKHLSESSLVLTEMLHKNIEKIGVKKGAFDAEINLSSKEVYGEISKVVSEINRMLKSGYRVTASFSSEERLKRFETLLHDKEFSYPYHIAKSVDSASAKKQKSTSAPVSSKKQKSAMFEGDKPKSGELLLEISDFEKGMVFDSFKTAILTETELFAAKKKRKKVKKGPMSVKAFTELAVGDYVVHDANGIGIFAGIVEMVRDRIKKDYVKINYAGSDVLYIPVESASSVKKYIGGSDNVKLSSLSSKSWKNQVSRAKKHIEEIADDLVELYAKRRSKIGFAYPPDTPWQAEFEDLFPYEETPDQLQATEEIKRDMESSVPMDRLLSGDVGYGKTEVALRAVFKAVSASKQVAILVPTTVLAQQHFTTVKERFSKYPVNVEMISRFRSAEEVRQILKKLKQGDVDILIGTHRILSKDVVFKDLGLLVIDEEQRLGVRHKEAIKLFKENIDVLTLTATPIPRTLHMSMIGVRDMSVLDDPPEERMPVQTYVAEYSDAVAREAMLRELERGGQIYYVYNRIEGIERIKERIEEMIPSASVRIAHGRMTEESLENVMLDFMEGKFDILVTTTIIETGLDIPNVNTMIVRRADMFGLSQLYQLRGRVGRSSRRGYCYAFFQKGKMLNEVQERRLRAIREFTDFGSGFKIAMRDLEIRGAGSILGTAQSGFMDTVGYDMFIRLLEQAVRKRNGEEMVDKTEARVELNASAYIPKTYVEDAQTRISLYRQISSMETGIDSILNDVEDRFGKAPRELKNLLNIAEIKNLAEEIGVVRIGEESGELYFKFKKDIAFDLERFGEMLKKIKSVTYRSGTSEELRMDRPKSEEWTDIVAKTMRKVYSYLGN